MQWSVYWKPLCRHFHQALSTSASLSLPCPCQSLKDLPDVSALDIQLCCSCLCYFWLCNRCGWRNSCSVMLTSRWWVWGEKKVWQQEGGLRKWVTGGSRQVVGRGAKWWVVEGASAFNLFYFYFMCTSIFFCMYVCVVYACLVPKKTRLGSQILLKEVYTKVLGKNLLIDVFLTGHVIKMFKFLIHLKAL